MELSEDYIFSKLEAAIKGNNGELSKMELFRIFKSDFPEVMPIVRELVRKQKINESYFKEESSRRVPISERDARDNTTWYRLPCQEGR